MAGTWQRHRPAPLCSAKGIRMEKWHLSGWVARKRSFPFPESIIVHQLFWYAVLQAPSSGPDTFVSRGFRTVKLRGCPHATTLKEGEKGSDDGHMAAGPRPRAGTHWINPRPCLH
ncbi:hypothetical protein MAPG_08976 [Magnaporthiopsis poae ATCC 64411]|uniref:Uncharacterized protein n=1 Tax=Magnaporthiopsis poae (strain ATCC 64411 / 73-15) TaxID=644358 RepID=A0A0C4E8R0_MAGP6|nr:hypothetical protein MAPG_08976 [Magnaporthiopsis poae ATCC 64411]